MKIDTDLLLVTVTHLAAYCLQWQLFQIPNGVSRLQYRRVMHTFLSLSQWKHAYAIPTSLAVHLLFFLWHRKVRTLVHETTRQPSLMRDNDQVKSCHYLFYESIYLVLCFDHLLGLWKTKFVFGGSLDLGSVASHTLVTWGRDFHPVVMHTANYRDWENKLCYVLKGCV